MSKISLKVRVYVHEVLYKQKKKALKGEAIVCYCESLITQLEDSAYCGEMKASFNPSEFFDKALPDQGQNASCPLLSV